MDNIKLVSKKLLQKDKCVAALQGSYMDSNEKCPSILSIVENVDGHCIFLYILVTLPPSSSNDLELFKVMEVDFELKYSVNAAKTKLTLSNAKQTFTFETVSPSETVDFIAEMEHARQVHSQNAVFATPSFAWMDRYVYPPSATTTTTNIATTNSSNNINNNNSTAGSTSGRTSILPDSLIRFEDTTTTATAGSGVDGWPFNQIIQLDSGKPCPVVKDSTTPSNLANVNQSNSNNRGNGKTTNNIDNVHRSNSRDKLRDRNDGPQKVYPKRDPLNPVNPMHPMMSSREMIISLMLKERQNDYTSLSNYRVFCGTWNVNGQSPTTELSDWLATESERLTPPDIYAIGLQEMDLSKNLYLLGESARESEWVTRVEEALRKVSKDVRYVKVQSVRLIAILLVVYVKDTIRSIGDVMVESAPTGFFGVVGNKGGVAIRMKIQDTTLCFVNSHLCAHTEEWMRRNQDYKDINSKLLFRNSANRYLTISDHDMIFWFGDLNYRISDIDTDDCKLYIDSNKLDNLLDFDQLVRQMAMKRVFLDYKEGPLNFKPTYKFDPGTDNWDTEKVRAPAWCDRVLWKGDNIEQLSYRSHPKLRLSDHKPVSAVFIAGVKVINNEKERAVREQINKMIDMRENEFLPKATLNVREIFFTDLKYLDTQQQAVVLTNTGKVLVQFEFVCKDEDLRPFKPWLQVQPSDGFLHPGENVSIQLEVQINSKTVQDWQNCQIEDNLILQLQGGQSIFLPISGTRKPSCFGLPLKTLVNIFRPVADALSDNFQLKQQSGPTERPLDIPKELWFLVDFLFKNGMDQIDMFQILGIEDEIRQIRNVLDTTTKGLDHIGRGIQIHSVAETLLIFLDSLPEPVVPYSLYDRCLESSNFKQAQEVLELMPACHKNVFKYICAFLREFVSLSNKNQSDVRVLAHIFGAVLLKPADESTGYQTMSLSAEENNKKATFVQRFIQND